MAGNKTAEMGDSSSTSSDEDVAPQRARLRRSLNDDRGVIKRDAWAGSDGSESSSSSNSGTEEADSDTESNASDDIPLAQTEMQPATSDSDSSESGNENEDGSLNDSDGDGDDDEEDDEEETEDLDIRVKQEQLQTANHANEKVTEDDDENVSNSVGDSSDNVTSVKDEVEDEDASGSATSDAADTRSRNELKIESNKLPAKKRKVQTSSAADDSGSEWEPEDEGDGNDATELDPHDVRRNEETGEDQPYDNAEEKRNERNDDNDDEDEAEVEERESIQKRDFSDAKYLFSQLQRTYLPSGERPGILQGRQLSGPPIDRPVSQGDQWKRKYRWPIAMRNVRRRNFIANAEDLSTDYEVPLQHTEPDPTRGPSATAREAFAAALAPTVRPLMETALSTFRDHQSKKRRRELLDERATLGSSNHSEHSAVDLVWLRTLARLGGHFTDQVLDSVLVKNSLALQGIDASYAQQCWDPLPLSKRPVANWRFVLEHFCKNASHGVDAPTASPCSTLRKETLVRVRDRLRTLYGLSWRPEDDAFFNLVDDQAPDPMDIVDEEIIQL